ncbi:MAG: hypothetical protein ABC542_02740 [Candidatus Methanosuratincola petrocarbonis]
MIKSIGYLPSSSTGQKMRKSASLWNEKPSSKPSKSLQLAESFTVFYLMVFFSSTLQQQYSRTENRKGAGALGRLGRWFFAHYFTKFREWEVMKGFLPLIYGKNAFPGGSYRQKEGGRSGLRAWAFPNRRFIRENSLIQTVFS